MLNAPYTSSSAPTMPTGPMSDYGPDRSTPPGAPDGPAPSDEEQAAEERAVKKYLSESKAAKQRYGPDFKRMMENMEFVAGLQHDGQKTIRDTEGRYVCNLTLSALQQKVAQLYARNPQVEVSRSKQLLFQLWDGKVETLQDCFMRMQAGRMMGVPDMEAEATLMDFKQGRNLQSIIEKVAKTLELVLGYQVRVHKPDFKEQMKQLVVRAATCGVAYVVPQLILPSRERQPNATGLPSLHEEVKLMQGIVSRLADGTLDQDSPEVDTLKTLALSIGVQTTEEPEYQLDERIEFDFPPATSVYPDTRCRNLREWVGAKRVFREFPMTIDDANDWFGLSEDDAIQGSQSSALSLSNDRPVVENAEIEPNPDTARSPMCVVIQVYDIETKSSCFIVEGRNRYLEVPQPVEPCIQGFWPIFTLTLNNLEIEVSNPEMTVSIFPPSDVDLMRDPQKEWNRTRDALRAQRNANAPTYLIRDGTLSEEDIDRIRDREPNEVVQLKGLPADKEPAQVIQVLQVAAIDNRCYDTSPMEQDLQLSAGMQQANMGPAQSNVTATVGTIAEQSRLTVSSSNTDAIDGLLSRLMQACGEMILSSFSEDTVRRIAGVGATWPSLDRSDYLCLIDITIKAGSSGKPNHAIKVNTAMQLAPLLMQLGANPVTLIEYLVHTLDDTGQLDPQTFFPLPGQMAALLGPPGQQGPPQGPPGPQQPQGNPQRPQPQQPSTPLGLVANGQPGGRGSQIARPPGPLAVARQQGALIPGAGSAGAGVRGPAPVGPAVRTVF